MTNPARDFDNPELAAQIAAGLNPVRAFREALGYSVDDLSVTCGLAAAEILDLELGVGVDLAKARRIEAALRLGEGKLVRFLIPDADVAGRRQ
jgi:transcriptional regulator with XRE-family HTH domain